MLAALLAIFVPVIFFAGFISLIIFLTVDWGEVRIKRAVHRRYAVYGKIAKQKPKRNTYKNLQYLKKLLRNERCARGLIFDVIEVRRRPWFLDLPCDENRREADYLWKFTERRQLFNKKELKVIDQGNAKIEKELRSLENVPEPSLLEKVSACAAFSEAKENALKRGSVTAVDPIENRMPNDLGDSAVAYKFPSNPPQ